MLFGKKLTKEIIIEGMHCMHCAKATEEALKGVNGVCGVKIDLEAKKAIVQSRTEIDENELRKAVKDAGFEAVEIR